MPSVIPVFISKWVMFLIIWKHLLNVVKQILIGILKEFMTFLFLKVLKNSWSEFMIMYGVWKLLWLLLVNIHVYRWIIVFIHIIFFICILFFIFFFQPFFIGIKINIIFMINLKLLWFKASFTFRLLQKAICKVILQILFVIHF